MPAFLHQDLRILEAIRIEDGIEIDIHQVVEIDHIAAGDRIHGLIRPGDRIEEGIERTFRKLDEGFLQRIFARAAERRVLHNMRRPFGIIRRRAETNIKDFIIIIAVQIQQTGTAFDVLHQVGIGIDFFNMGHAADTESVHQVSIIPFHIRSP